MSRVEPTIFRSYDVRGVVETDLTPEAVELVGRAYAKLSQERGVKRVTVGRDCRESSPKLFEALATGLTRSGIDVWDIGVVATPMQYFSIVHFEADGGIMITGSHNPPEYNGLKISIGRGTIHGDDIQKLRQIIEADDFVEGTGRIESVDVVTPYRQYLENNIQLGPRRLKVVLDAGNGTAGPFAPPIFEALGVDVVPLFCDMDPSFPNHHPDPTVESNLAHLKEAVAESGADFGIAFDGDGDRIGVIDDELHVMWGDQLMMLFARAVLKEQPGAAIVGEVKCSRSLYEDIANHGGKPVMWKAGHSLIKSKMKEVDAALAGEMSGHIFFAHRYFGFDDATYAGLRLCEILSNTDEPLSALLSDVKKRYSTPEIRVDCAEEEKFALVERAVEHFRKNHEVVDVDGVRIEMEDGWGLVRASNTQPILVLRFEADTPERCEEIRRYVEGELNKLRAS